VDDDGGGGGVHNDIAFCEDAAIKRKTSDGGVLIQLVPLNGRPPASSAKHMTHIKESSSPLIRRLL